MRIPRPTRLVVLALLAGALAPASAAAAPVDEQIIVRHRAGLDAAERRDNRADADTSFERSMRLPNTEVVAVEDGTRAQALGELRRDPDVLWAVPNGTASITTNDQFWSSLHALQNLGQHGRRIDADIDAESAWTLTTGAGVTVAVVDTGVQAGHPDLAGRVDTANAYDFVEGDADASDPNGHGTHVAGIVAAAKDNGIGVAGIAPAATILPVRVLGANGKGYWDDILDGLDWAGAKGAKVVNASLGGGYDASLDLALRQVFASHPGSLYVISAGNDSFNNDIPLAGSLPCVSSGANVLCVGSSDEQDGRSSFSNYGVTTVDVFAPGSAILSTVPYGSGYDWMSGTSMAAPYAAGTAALVIAKTGKTGADAATILKGTVDRPAALAGLAVTGGRINAARAVGAAVDAPTPGVVESAVGATNAATITMAVRESDIAEYAVSMDGAHIGTVASRSFTVTGLPAGPHTFTIVVRNSSGLTAGPSAPATVQVSGPAAAAPTAPATPRTRPGTASTPTPSPAAVSAVRLVTRLGRRHLVFRVATTTRVTVTLARRRGGTYRRTASKTVRLTPGMQSLPVTSRLLGMRVPRGRWRVTVGTANATAARVTFTKR